MFNFSIHVSPVTAESLIQEHSSLQEVQLTNPAFCLLSPESESFNLQVTHDKHFVGLLDGASLNFLRK